MPPQDAATATVGDRPATDGGPDRRLLIDGQLVATGRVFASVNPATGTVIGHAPDAGIDEARQAISAGASFPSKAPGPARPSATNRSVRRWDCNG